MAGATGETAVEWFDCCAGFGISKKPPARFSATAEDLIEEMDFCGVAEALVYHAAAVEEAAVVGNRLVAEAAREHPRLHPCWAILPPETEELGTVADFLDEMRRHRVRALRAWPEEHRYLLNAITLGPLLEEIVARRIPLLVGPDWPALTALLADFPALTMVVVGHGSWGQDRFFRPLLKRYAKLHIDLSLYHQDHGLSHLVRRYGAERMLYASGYPQWQMGGSLLMVAHADISDDDRAAIAGENLRRLLREAKP